ncbi:40778_t:CDS:2 [Gigaspora margarita]|uniref:40778_t:CDS:1 n=1 Tax=Gigaspora margarita TaxID=4874 RepID=A0ABN7VDL1_GIGMA|nr:40778_t:CDS:2 [Gigaspora margarita]
MNPIYYDDEDNSTYIPIETGYYSGTSRLTVSGVISSCRGSDSGIVTDDVDDIVQIVCSPNMNYVATTYKYIYENSDAAYGDDLKESAYNDDDDKISKASLWAVIKTKKLEKISEIMGHKINESKAKLWAVSVDKYIVFKTNYLYYNFEVFNAKGEHKELFFSNPHNLVNQLAFIKRKLILFNNQTFQLTKWDISTLTFETNCMIDWCYKVRNVEVNQGGELLAVYAVYLQKEALKKSKLYVYSLKSGINMALCDYDEKRVVDNLYFIAYKAGERLLIRSRNPFNDELYIELVDPFTLKTPQIWDPFIIKSDIKSDNIIGIKNDNLDIYELLELSQTDWTTYLWKELGDYNRIFVLSDTEKYIKKMINDELNAGKIFIDPEISLEIDNNFTFEAQILNQSNGDWRPVEGESKRMINPNFQPPEHTRKLKIMQCQYYIITGEEQELEMKKALIYIWKDNPFYIPLNSKPYSNAFPNSKFLIIIKNQDLTFGDKKQFFFKELLEDYISDKFFIINYGSILMEHFLFLKEDEWVEKFCKACYDIVFSTNASKFLPGFLSQTTFVMPLTDPEMILDSNIVSVSSIKHLSYFGIYNHVNELRKLITKINAGDWNSIEKPFVPQILLTATQTPSEDYNISESISEIYHKLKDNIYEVKI